MCGWSIIDFNLHLVCLHLCACVCMCMYVQVCVCVCVCCKKQEVCDLSVLNILQDLISLLKLF